MLDQRGNILAPSRSGGATMNDVQAVEQVFAEGPCVIMSRRFRLVAAITRRSPSLVPSAPTFCSSPVSNRSRRPASSCHLDFVEKGRPHVRGLVCPVCPDKRR
jgi:hypothetical protein